VLLSGNVLSEHVALGERFHTTILSKLWHFLPLLANFTFW